MLDFIIHFKTSPVTHSLALFYTLHQVKFCETSSLLSRRGGEKSYGASQIPGKREAPLDLNVGILENSFNTFLYDHVSMLMVSGLIH